MDNVNIVYKHWYRSLYPQVQRHPAPSRQGSDGDGSSWWEAAWAMLPSSPSTYSYTYTSSTVEEVSSTVHINNIHIIR